MGVAVGILETQTTKDNGKFGFYELVTVGQPAHCEMKMHASQNAGDCLETCPTAVVRELQTKCKFLQPGTTRLSLQKRLTAGTGQRSHPQDITLPLSHRDNPLCIKQVEHMRCLDCLVVGGVGHDD